MSGWLGDVTSQFSESCNFIDCASGVEQLDPGLPGDLTALFWGVVALAAFFFGFAAAAAAAVLLLLLLLLLLFCCSLSLARAC